MYTMKVGKHLGIKPEDMATDGELHSRTQTHNCVKKKRSGKAVY